MIVTIEIEFEIGQVVYLKTDTDQTPRMVTQIAISGSGGLLYRLTCGTNESFHYEIEISAEKNLVMA